jgi:hypothetical protein
MQNLKFAKDNIWLKLRQYICLDWKKKRLYRNKPKSVRVYNTDFANKYRDLVESFSREQFIEYDQLVDKWGKGRERSILTNKIKELNITEGPVYNMIILRETNLADHKKAKAMLYNRWTSIYDHRKKLVNLDENKIWYKMASNIQRRCNVSKIQLFKEWDGEEGRQLLADFLKNLYNKQEKLCAITKELITMETGSGRGTLSTDNKCSVDRKNSNKGYTPDNIWITAWWVNNMKSDMSLVKFYKRVKIIADAKLKI